MHLLITGICGFVGSTLAHALLEHAAPGELTITGLDNLSRAGSWRNREALIRKQVTVLHGDIRNASDLDSIGPVDWVIDAAANPSVLAGVDGKCSSRQLVEHNLAGTINLLEYCKQFQAGFTLLSTSRVYSIPPLARLNVVECEGAFQPVAADLPPGVTQRGITETFSTAAPVSLYGATKLASEQLALEYGQAFDFPVWINRCGVLAGAGQFGKPDQGIFAYWLHSWRESRELKYIGFGGNGYQVRDCLHPRDLVPLLKRQMADSAGHGRPSVVNVSGGRAWAISLAQLSDWCSDRWGPQPIAADPRPRPFDLPWIVLDHTQASETWDWQPTTALHDILTEIAEFAEQHPEWMAQSQ